MTTRNLGMNEAQAVAPRRSYSAPRFVEYGSLTLITQTVKEGGMGDPGGPGGGKSA